MWSSLRGPQPGSPRHRYSPCTPPGRDLAPRPYSKIGSAPEDEAATAWSKHMLILPQLVFVDGYIFMDKYYNDIPCIDWTSSLDNGMLEPGHRGIYLAKPAKKCLSEAYLDSLRRHTG